MNANVDPVVLVKIRKLLRLAHDKGAAVGEVENAMRFARRMMDQCGITEDVVLLEESVEQTAGRIVEEVAARRKAGIETFDSVLANVPKYICDVGVYLDWGRDAKTGKYGQAVIFYGQPRDVAVAKAMYSELRLTMRTMARFVFGPQWSRQHSDYTKGFVSRLCARAQELKRAAQSGQGLAGADGATCTAIVLRKDVALSTYEAGLGLRYGQSRGWRVGGAGAFNRGREDAENVDLNTNGIGAGESRPELKQIR